MRGAGSVYLVSVGLVLCLAGGVFAWLGWRSYERASSQRQWVATECRIIESGIEERKIGADVATEYRFAVLYGYEFGGEAYTSERYSLRGSPWGGSAGSAERLSEEFETGSLRTCFVNPAQPEFAVLKRDSKAAGYSLWFPLLIVAGGVGIIVGGVRGILAARRNGRNESDGEGKGPGAVAPGEAK